MKTYIYDKLLLNNLAHASLFYENNLKCEQRVIIIANTFVQAIRHKSKQDLMEMKMSLLHDYKTYPAQAYLFRYLLGLVEKQLHKSGTA